MTAYAGTQEMRQSKITDSHNSSFPPEPSPASPAPPSLLPSPSTSTSKQISIELSYQAPRQHPHCAPDFIRSHIHLWHQSPAVVCVTTVPRATQEIKAALPAFSLKMVREEPRVECHYCQDPNSFKQRVYHSVFFTCVKE